MRLSKHPCNTPTVVLEGPTECVAIVNAFYSAFTLPDIKSMFVLRQEQAEKKHHSPPTISDSLLKQKLVKHTKVLF